MLLFNAFCELASLDFCQDLKLKLSEVKDGVETLEVIWILSRR